MICQFYLSENTIRSATDPQENSNPQKQRDWLQRVPSKIYRLELSPNPNWPKHKAESGFNITLQVNPQIFTRDREDSSHRQ